MPPPRASAPSRRTGMVGGAALAAALLLPLRWRDPHVPGSWGMCPWLVSTGTPCPTCGGLRALADLLAGRPGPAFAHHPYLVATLAALIPLAAAVEWRSRGRRRRRPGLTRTRTWPRRPAWVAPAIVWLVGLLVFGVARMLVPGWWPSPGAA